MKSELRVETSPFLIQMLIMWKPFTFVLFSGPEMVFVLPPLSANFGYGNVHIDFRISFERTAAVKEAQMDVFSEDSRPPRVDLHC